MRKSPLWKGIREWFTGRPPVEGEAAQANRPAGAHGRAATTPAAPSAVELQAPPPACAAQPPATPAWQQPLETLTEHLADLAAAQGQLARSVEQLHQDVTRRLTAKPLADDLQPLADELAALRQAQQAQLECLQRLGEQFAATRAQQSGASSSAQRIGEAIESLSRNSAAHAGVMEQIRDWMSGTNQQVAETVANASRRIEWLLGGAFVMLAALTVLAALMLILR